MCLPPFAPFEMIRLSSRWPVFYSRSQATLLLTSDVREPFPQAVLTIILHVSFALAYCESLSLLWYLLIPIREFHERVLVCSFLNGL